MRTRTLQAGLSLPELLIGLAVGSVVLAGTVAMFSQLSQMNARQRMESLVNDTYYQGMRVALNTYLFSENNPAAVSGLGLSGDLKLCLMNNPRYDAASGPFDCRQLDTKTTNPGGLAVPDAIDTSLNAAFSFNGRCVGASDPSCLVQRRTTYAWVCPSAQYCSGLELDLSAAAIATPGGSATTRTGFSVRTRAGTVFYTGRQLMNKGEISFTCAANNNFAIYGLDYVNLSDRGRCANFDPGPACANPMNTYGQTAAGANCVPPQGKPCGDGFMTAGLFTAQQQCIPPATGIPGSISTGTTPPPTSPGCPPGQVMTAGVCAPAPAAAGHWVYKYDFNGAVPLGTLITPVGGLAPYSPLWWGVKSFVLDSGPADCPAVSAAPGQLISATGASAVGSFPNGNIGAFAGGACATTGSVCQYRWLIIHCEGLPNYICVDPTGWYVNTSERFVCQ